MRLDLQPDIQTHMQPDQQRGRAIVGDGTPEAEWQRWAGLQRLPVCGFEDIVPRGARLVVVAPHPDDEVLACGGLLALAAERAAEHAVEVCIVGVTDGDASHAGSTRWPPHRLARERRAERLRGLACLGWGAGVQVRLGLPDGDVAGHRDALIDALHALLTPHDVVISTWALDGHPDHEASGQATASASAAIGCRHMQAPVWMWHWAAPGDARVPWRQMRRLPLPMAAWQRKSAAIHAHRTQLEVQDTGAMPVLPAAALARLLRHDEVFIASPGRGA